MRCDNCRADCTPAFTLAAHPVRGGDAVVVDFCSIDCLQAWTADGEGQRPESGERARDSSETATPDHRERATRAG